MTKQMLAAMASGLALMAAVPAVAQQGGSTVTAATTQGPILSFSVSEEESERRQRVSVDVSPGLSVETSRALSWSGREEDDRIGVKWMLRY